MELLHSQLVGWLVGWSIPAAKKNSNRTANINTWELHKYLVAPASSILFGWMASIFCPKTHRLWSHHPIHHPCAVSAVSAVSGLPVANAEMLPARRYTTSRGAMNFWSKGCKNMGNPQGKTSWLNQEFPQIHQLNHDLFDIQYHQLPPFCYANSCWVSCVWRCFESQHRIDKNSRILKWRCCM